MWGRHVLIPSDGISSGIVVRSKRGVLGAAAIVQQHAHTDFIFISNTSAQTLSVELYIVTP